jgi:uncharacterized protein YjcR
MAKVSHNCTEVHPNMTHYEWAKKNDVTPGTIRDWITRPKDRKKDKKYMKKVKKDKNPLTPFKSGGKIHYRGNKQHD